MKSVAQVNAMPTIEFVASFGHIAEHSPWVAEVAASTRPFAHHAAMVEAFTNAVMKADEPAQLALLRAHPDLATRARLTDHSAGEQAGAGLAQLSAQEFNRFTQLNDAYKARFGFPFIFAVKGATKQQILAGFEARIGNTRADEFQTALAQVCRILQFRLEAEVAP